MISFEATRKSRIEVEDLDELLSGLSLFSPVWQMLPNTVFFIKNTDAQYLYVNDTLLHRLKLADKGLLIGKTSEELFCSEWGRRYTEQDYDVLQQGVTITDKLELHTYSSGRLGWCLTCKMPVWNHHHDIIGMMGISADFDHQYAHASQMDEKIARTEKYIVEHYAKPIRMKDLVEAAQLPQGRLERYFKRIFNLTPAQYIQKVRMEAAIGMLGKSLTITEISAACGYTDHSAFTRQFKTIVGVSPSEFKKNIISNEENKRYEI